MKLRATDQLHVSGVRSDVLRPGEVFEVSDERGRELLAMDPRAVAPVVDLAAEKPALAKRRRRS